jgi:hypothetical protein
MLTRHTLLAVLVAGLATSAWADTAPTPREILGTWEYLSIDAVGRITFSPDHRVTLSFLMDANGNIGPGATFDPVAWGKWRLKGNQLIYGYGNRTLRYYQPEMKFTIARVERNRIIFTDGSTLKRVR